MKKNNWFVRSCYGILFCMNLLSAVLLLIYRVKYSSNPFWNGAGILILTTLTTNLFLTISRNKRKWIDILYLAMSSGLFFFLPLTNIALSSIVQNKNTQNHFFEILTIVLLLVGATLPLTRIFNLSSKMPEREFNVKKAHWMVRTIKVGTLFLLTLILIYGLRISYLLLKGGPGIFEVFIPELALFFSFFFLSIAIFIHQLVQKNKFFFKTAVLATGVCIFAINLLPFASVPYLLYNAKKQYNAVFSNQPQQFEPYQSYLTQNPFSVMEYLFGAPSNDYKVIENILYYEGTKPGEENLKLYFDVYMPKEDGTKLPGKNAVLIRIHGGAWIVGDKGIQNIAQVNKYYAAQGYVVFDVQYGLNNKKVFIKGYKAPKNIGGDFTIDDMVAHIGYFTQYLSKNNAKYNADISSVFISGGSAGGHLTCVTAFAMQSGKYDNLYGKNITLKGIIPLYPANGLAKNVGIEGTEEWVNPINLIQPQSPPCLVYHGDKDGMVSPKVAQILKQQYLENGNPNCAVLTFPLASHGSDNYYAGYYNQIFNYYMERFLLTYR